MKRRILIGFLSGPNFAIQTAKVDRSLTSFGELLFQTLHERKQFVFFPLFLANNFSLTSPKRPERHWRARLLRMGGGKALIYQ